MPSKKKNSKSTSKLSINYDSSPSPSPSYSAVSSISSSPLFNSEYDLSSSLDDAAAKFPSLISTSAFAGRVSDDVVSSSRGCRIWLSESAMLSNSIAPGSLVSVSLAASWEDVTSGGFPLSRISDECARQIGLDLAENSGNEAGDFFVLATVFPSCKVLKNGVRLSSNLSCMLGSPASGRTAFVYPVKCQPLYENGNGGQCGLVASCLSFDSCKDLYLSLVHFKDKSKMQSAMSSPVDLSKKVANGQVGNGKVSSPKTPSSQESEVNSPFRTRPHKLDYNKSASTETLSSPAAYSIIDVKEVLGDDSSKKLLEVCSASWLCSLVLLSGNFVRVPVLSRLCIFQVVGSEILLPNSDNRNTRSNGFPAPTQDFGKEAISAFSVDRETKVHLLLPGDSMVETAGGKALPLPELNGRTIDNMGVRFPKLGGVSEERAVLTDIIVSSVVKGTVASLGLRPTKGVLLHGPPGTGKTTLARLCAQDAGVNLFPVNGPEIISQYHGESEQALHEVFAKASQAAPAVVFIDELDAIAPARKDGGDVLSQRMVATLLNLMDGIGRTDGMLIIAATNRPQSIEPALRRPGRLDREVEIGVPSRRQRHEILDALLSEMQHSLLDEDVIHLAMNTHGFVGADLAALCNEAAIVRIRQYVNLSHIDSDSDFKLSIVAFDSIRQASSCQTDVCLNAEMDTAQSSGDSVKSNSELLSCTQNDILRVTSEDFEKARVRIRPSAMREVIVEVPKVSWQDVGGQAEVKMQLMEAVEWPQKHESAFKRIGTRPPTGILLFGPPGCSKTLLARAVASEARLNFLAVKGPELFSKWVGESEKAVRSLFAKARANAPSIIFFDEIDGLAIIRGKESDGVSVGDRVMSQLLVELDGLQQRGSVTVIAATNRPDKIDPALLRPGRFDRLLYVGPPNVKDREDIFRIHLQRMPCSSDVSVSELSVLTEGCTGADISLICREAAIAAIEENLSATEVTMEQLKSGIRQVQPSDVQMYDELLNKFQRLVHSTAKEDRSGCESWSTKQSQLPFWSKVRSAVLSLFGYY